MVFSWNISGIVALLYFGVGVKSTCPSVRFCVPLHLRRYLQSCVMTETVGTAARYYLLCMDLESLHLAIVGPLGSPKLEVPRSACCRYNFN